MGAAGIVSRGVRREAFLLSRRQPVTGGAAGARGENPSRATPASGAGVGAGARERVTAAAFEVHARATADSAVYGHPGFVPGGSAAGRGPGAAAAVAELCAAGVWEPVPGGYRILD